MSTVYASLVPVFLLIVTGALLRRWLLADEAHWAGVERLVYYVLFPALLVETLASANLAGVPFAEVGTALAAAVLLMSATCLLLRPLLARRLGMNGAAFTSLFQGATRWQTFVALAVVGNLYGDRGLTLAAVAIVAMIPLLNVINVWVLAHFAAVDGPDWRRVLLAIARNPLIWGCVMGAALHAAPVLPRPATVGLDLLGRSSLPVGLLLVGSGLDVGRLVRPHAVTFIAAALKLIGMPAMAVAFGLALGLTGISLAVVACCASVPSASNAYVLARQMGGNAPLMAEILTVQTLAAFVTMPVAIALAGAA